MSQLQGMTPEQVQAAVLAALTSIAPEIDAGGIRPDGPLRTQFDLDSMDYLNFLLALEADLGVTIPEADYGRITSLEGCVAYLMAGKVPPAEPPAR